MIDQEPQSEGIKRAIRVGSILLLALWLIGLIAFAISGASALGEELPAPLEPIPAKPDPLSETELAMYRTKWFGQCAGNRPSLLESLEYRTLPKPKPLGPITNRQRDSVMRELPTCSTIARLNLPGCPSAIVWLVNPIVVDSVNRVLFTGARPHVSQEVSKASSPAFAHDNPSTTVPLKATAVRIVASLKHGVPNAKFRGATAGSCSAVDESPANQQFIFKAAATLRVPRRKGIAFNDSRISACAATEPNCRTPFVRALTRKNGKPTENLSSQVFELSAGMTSIGSSHKKPFHDKGNEVVKPGTSLQRCDRAVSLYRLACKTKDEQPNVIQNFGCPEGTVIDCGSFLLAFDGRTRLPRWTLEHLTADSIKGDAPRPDSFRVDSRIPAEFRVTDRDYAGYGFDRGHLAPAADFGEQCEKANTFVLSNVCPQNPSLNRGLWNQLEQSIRERLTANNQAWVCTFPVFMPTAKGTHYVQYQIIGPNGVAVPSHIAKSLLLDDGQQVTLETWLAPNREPTHGTTLDDWRTATDYVERVAGLDLWAGLSDELETKLESAK